MGSSDQYRAETHPRYHCAYNEVSVVANRTTPAKRSWPAVARALVDHKQVWFLAACSLIQLT